MSDEKSDGEVTPPDITTLGHWPAAEEAIRKLGRDHRVPAEDIEAFLDAIKTARQMATFARSSPTGETK